MQQTSRTCKCVHVCAKCCSPSPKPHAVSIVGGGCDPPALLPIPILPCRPLRRWRGACGSAAVPPSGSSYATAWRPCVLPWQVRSSRCGARGCASVPGSSSRKMWAWCNDPSTCALGVAVVQWSCSAGKSRLGACPRLPLMLILLCCKSTVILRACSSVEAVLQPWSGRSVKLSVLRAALLSLHAHTHDDR